MNTLLVWGGVSVFSLLMLWLLLREVRKGAVNQFKANEQASTEKLRRELNEIRRNNDRLAADAKRIKLRDKYSRD